MKWTSAFIVLAALAACRSSSAAAKPEAQASSAYELRGSRMIGCCCNAPCPCRINKKPTYCHGCDHTDAVHIDRGVIGTTDMSGMTWVIVGRGFGDNVDGNWAYVYVTDKATDEQFKALQDMLTSQVQAWGAKAPHLAGKFLGMRKVPMQYTVSPDKRAYDCVIPGILQFRTRAIVNPGNSEPVMSIGILDSFGNRFVHAEAVAHEFNDAQIKYSWNLTGRQANFAEFVLTPDTKANGGGWGCWTAHSQYGDKEPYQEQIQEHK